MLVHNEKKILFLRNPKTASRYITKEFLKAGFEEIYQHHSVIVTDHMSDFDVYVVVRNPLSRCVSLYEHAVANWDKIGFNSTFEEFLKTKDFSPRDGNCNWFYQHFPILNIKNKIHILRFEKLRQELCENFSFHNWSTRTVGQSRKMWQPFYEPKIFDLAVEILEPDFDYFGYKKRIKPVLL